MDTIGTCIICDYHGPRSQHRCTAPDVPNGYSFFANGKRHFADKPSIQVADIKLRLGIDPVYLCLQGEARMPLSDANAVDLRSEPQLFFVPPATY